MTHCLLRLASKQSYIWCLGMIVRIYRCQLNLRCGLLSRDGNQLLSHIYSQSCIQLRDGQLIKFLCDNGKFRVSRREYFTITESQFVN